MKQEDNGFPKQSDAMHCVAVQRASERAGSEIKARTNLEDEKPQKNLTKKTKTPQYKSRCEE